MRLVLEAKVPTSEFCWETACGFHCLKEMISLRRTQGYREQGDLLDKWDSLRNEWGIADTQMAHGDEGVVRPLTQSWIQILCESSAAPVPPWYQGELTLVLTLQPGQAPELGLRSVWEHSLFLRCLMLTNRWTVFTVHLQHFSEVWKYFSSALDIVTQAVESPNGFLLWIFPENMCSHCPWKLESRVAVSPNPPAPVSLQCNWRHKEQPSVWWHFREQLLFSSPQFLSDPEDRFLNVF